MEQKINPVKSFIAKKVLTKKKAEGEFVDKSMDNDKLGRTSNGIKKILETEIAPMLAMHGGRVEFVSFEEGTVKIRLKGACHGCALSELTLKEGVERILKEKIRKIKSVENVEPR